MKSNYAKKLVAGTLVASMTITASMPLTGQNGSQGRGQDEHVLVEAHLDIGHGSPPCQREMRMGRSAGAARGRDLRELASLAAFAPPSGYHT